MGIILVVLCILIGFVMKVIKRRHYAVKGLASKASLSSNGLNVHDHKVTYLKKTKFQNAPIVSMAESTDPRTATKTPKELIKRFYFLQEERVHTYHLFDEGFKAYLSGAPNYNFPLYRQLVHEITQTFQNISNEIISIKTELSDSQNLKTLASLVEKVQDKEKCKLELTVNLQLAEKDVKDNQGVESYVDKVAELKERMKEILEEINEVLEEIKYESEDLYDDEAMDVAER